MIEKAYVPEEQKSYSIARLNSLVLIYAFLTVTTWLVINLAEKFATHQVSVKGKLENSAAVAEKLMISVFAEMPFNK